MNYGQRKKWKEFNAKIREAILQSTKEHLLTNDNYINFIAVDVTEKLNISWFRVDEVYKQIRTLEVQKIIKLDWFRFSAKVTII